MFSLTDVRFHYDTPHGPVEALRGVSLSIERGEYVAVLGANGSGKSTLALLLGGLVVQKGGSFSVDGRPIATGEDLSFVRGVAALLLQNPDGSILGSTVERDVAFGLECARVPGGRMRERVARTLESFGVSHVAKRDGSFLSGGQTASVAVAGVAVLDRPALVFDEPTSLLDPQGRRLVLAHLDSLARSGRTVVHVTQYPHEAARAQRVIVLDMGGVVLDGTPADVLRRLDEVPALSAGLPELGPVGEPGEVVLSARDVRVVHDARGPNPVVAVDGVSLELRAGEATALIGPMGCGKTSLFHALAGLVADADVKLRGMKVRPGDVSVAFQSPERAFSEGTVEGEVGLALGAMRAEVKRERVKDALREVGLEPEGVLMRDPRSLSGGQARRIGIACALVTGADVVLLDEPDGALDPGGVSGIARITGSLAERGKAVCVATHHAGLALATCARVVEMREGRVVADVRGAERERLLAAQSSA